MRVVAPTRRGPARPSAPAMRAALLASCAAGTAAQAVCTHQVGVEMLGNDVAAPVAVESEAACCDSCASDARCAFWTYDEGVHGGLCHHKNDNGPDHSRQNGSCTSGFVGMPPPAPPAPARVLVKLGGRRHETGPNFVCWTIDASANREFFTRNLSAGSAYGAQLARQAAEIGALQDAGFSLLRFGGTGSDYLTYEVGGTPCPPPADTKQCLNRTQLLDLLSFARAANSKIMFGLSMNTGNDNVPNKAEWCASPSGIRSNNACCDGACGVCNSVLSLCGAAPGGSRKCCKDVIESEGRRCEDERDTGCVIRPSRAEFPFPWDPSNARAMLRWVLDHGYGDLIHGLGLGNELNTMYSPAKMAANFGVLHNLTLELWPHAASRPKLFGPDPHSYHHVDIDSYIADFVSECEKAGVPLYGATHHEYVEVDNTSFTSPYMLDLARQLGHAVATSIRARSGKVKIFASEVGPHNAGSPVCDHSFMRWATFGDSLWYADVLSAKARSGYEAVCRQDYIGADYGMVDCSSGVPLPDYYIALAWAGSMGPTVLHAGPAPGPQSTVRVYAHCVAQAAEAPAGSVALQVINLGDRATSVEVPQRWGPIARELVLSPSDDPADSLVAATGLNGTGVLLNGRPLRLGPGGSVPKLTGRLVGAQSAPVPATSIAFFILEEAKHAACGGGAGVVHS